MKKGPLLASRTPHNLKGIVHVADYYRNRKKVCGTAETQQTEETVEQIRRLWRHIFGKQSGLLHIFTGVRQGKELDSVREKHFPYPEEAPEAARYALGEAAKGREAFFCAHLLTKARCIKENAAPVQTLYAELDGVPIPNGELTPTAVVESSPGRFHVYWRLDSEIPPETAEDLNKRIALQIGADPSGYDLTQRFRVPGTANWKYEEQPTVELRDLDGGREYSPADLERVLPKIEDPGREKGPEGTKADADEPPVELGPEALKVWQGENPKLKEEEDGEIDTSATLLKIGRVMFDAGANRRVVIEALRERDVALGYCKYADRPDRGQREYERIYKKLEAEGRNGNVKINIEDRGSGTDSSDSSDSSDSFSKASGFIHTPSFPTDALPTKCATYVKEAAASLSCAPELVGIPQIAAISGAIGFSREIRIKPGWTESASLYLAVVDESGSRKSPAAALAYKPLEKLQATLRKAYKEELRTYEADLRQHAVNKRLAAKDDKPEPEPPVRPVMKRCIVDDITIEALATRMEQNPRGFVSHQDELTGFLRGMDQYKSGGKGNTRQSYLKMWSNRPIYVDRKGSDEPVVVPKPYLTLQGGIQPSVLHEIADGRDDGFLDRFDFAYPEPGRGGYSEKTVSHTAATDYKDVIGRLWDQGPKEADEGGELEPEVVSMDEEAKRLFVDEANKLSKEMNSPGFPPVLRGPWSKFDTKLARLILIISTARAAEAGATDIKLATGDDARAALRLLEYFKNATRKVYGQLFEANHDDVLAADLATLLEHSGYVYSGTVSKLLELLESNAKPDSPEALGKAIRRIAKRSPHLSVEAGTAGKDRKITVTLEKLSELSEPSESSPKESSPSSPDEDLDPLSEHQRSLVGVLVAEGMSRRAAIHEVTRTDLDDGSDEGHNHDA
jgi:hypothetical protein